MSTGLGTRAGSWGCVPAPQAEGGHELGEGAPCKTMQIKTTLCFLASGKGPDLRPCFKMVVASPFVHIGRSQVSTLAVISLRHKTLN